MQHWLQQYIQGLSSAEYQLHLLLLCVFIGFFIYKIHKTYQRFRFIGDTPTSKIASAAQGYVELKGLGELIPGPEIASPFSQQRCLWYQCIVEKRKRIKNHSVWVEESNQISDHLFHLQDESGSCVVIPDGAHVIPSKQTVWYGSRPEIRYRGGVKTDWFGRVLGFGRYRFTEKLILIADTLYVIGLFRTQQKTLDGAMLKSGVEQLVNKWKSNPSRYLKAFDFDDNGKIQGDEWKKIRQHAERIIHDQYQTTVHHIIQKPLENNQPFVISTLSEQQLLKRKRSLLMLNLALLFALMYVLLFFIQTS
jgi:hypothetical protein